MAKLPFSMSQDHPDFAVLQEIRDEIYVRCGGPEGIEDRFPALVLEAVEFVLDPVRTGRTRISDLDNVEKTFIGLKIEHFVRDLFDVPKDIRDLRIGKYDVDVKNTVRGNWMIPQESYRVSGPCLLIAVDEELRTCRMGLILAKEEYLNRPNQDRKRSVSAAGMFNILWLVHEAAWPRDRWAGLDMKRFRELRKISGGNRRLAQFLRENKYRPLHRTVIQSLLFDQDDFMKRLRKNGGVRDILADEGVAVLSGTYDKAQIQQLKLLAIEPDEFLVVDAAKV